MMYGFGITSDPMQIPRKGGRGGTRPSIYGADRSRADGHRGLQIRRRFVIPLSYINRQLPDAGRNPASFDLFVTRDDGCAKV